MSVRTSLISAAPQAAELERLELAMVPTPGSAVALVVNESMLSAFALPVSGGNGAATINASEDILSLSFDTPQYEGAIDAVAKSFTPVVQEGIRFARTVVNPDVTQVISRIEDISKSYVPYYVSQFNIVRENVPQPMRVESLMQVIESFVHKAPSAMNAHIPRPIPLKVFPYLDDSKLVSLLKLGNPQVDKAIDQWVANVGVSFLRDVYDSFFARPDAMVSRQSKYELERLRWTSYEAATVAMAVFLWANLILSDMPDEIKDGVTHSLKNMQNYLTDIRAYMADKLSIASEIQKASTKAGNLVTRVDTKNQTMYVNEPVYLDYLQNMNGSNEALFGYMILNEKTTNVKEIAGKSEKYSEAYYQFSVRMRMADDANSLSRTRKIFVDCMKELISSKGYTPQEEQAKYLKAVDLISNIPETGLKKSYELQLRVLEVVCRVLYPNTSAQTILESAIRCSEKEHIVEAREAATIATLNWVVDFLMSGVQLVDFKKLASLEGRQSTM